MLRVALTGNIASGKSTVADIWRRLGAQIIDADELSRASVLPGSHALAQIAERFGAGVLNPDGSLDRAALRRVAFGSAAARQALEEILHPEIARLREEAEHELAARGERVVVNVIPLLFEAGLEDGFDELVLVDAPESVRLERLVATRGLSREEAARMIAAQQRAHLKRARATHIIDNDGTLAQLEQKAAAVWRTISERAGHAS
jgi:dephospho-CoA kinase